MALSYLKKKQNGQCGFIAQPKAFGSKTPPTHSNYIGVAIKCIFDKN